VSFPGTEVNREIAMLVLSRKLGEKIVVGDNIVITVVKIDRNQIRIGIEAPQDVPVYREEIAPVRAGAAAPKGAAMLTH
jgi:carbon storage regulator